MESRSTGVWDESGLARRIPAYLGWEGTTFCIFDVSLGSLTFFSTCGLRASLAFEVVVETDATRSLLSFPSLSPPSSPNDLESSVGIEKKISVEP